MPDVHPLGVGCLASRFRGTLTMERRRNGNDFDTAFLKNSRLDRSSSFFFCSFMLLGIRMPLTPQCG